MTADQKDKIVRYRQQGIGYAQIATEIGVSKESVRSFCRRNHLMKCESPKMLEDSSRCRACGKPLAQEAGRKTKVFCSAGCRVSWWKAHPERLRKKAVYQFHCAGCGAHFTAYGNSKRKFCSHACYIHFRFHNHGGQTYDG